MSEVLLRIPRPLRDRVEGQTEIALQVEGGTVVDLLIAVVRGYSDLAREIITEQGHLRPRITLFVNDEDISYGQGLEAPIADGDVVTIVVPQGV